MPPDIKLRGQRPVGPELRSYPASFDVRSLSGSLVEVTGYASTTEQPYEMFDMFGPYTEIVRAGAFGKTLADGADVAYLANHEGLTMARSKTGTLKLAEDSTGLETKATVNTTRGDVRDLLTAIEDGNIDQMSFAFRVVRQQWSPDYDERALVELNLDRGDVSAVNFGANPNTSVGLQRAFRSRKPAELHRMAVEMLEGSFADTTRSAAAQMFELAASAAEATRDAPEPAPSPAVAEPAAALAEASQRAAAFLLLQREQEAERRLRAS